MIYGALLFRNVIIILRAIRVSLAIVRKKEFYFATIDMRKGRDGNNKKKLCLSGGAIVG